MLNGAPGMFETSFRLVAMYNAPKGFSAAG